MTKLQKSLDVQRVEETLKTGWYQTLGTRLYTVVSLFLSWIKTEKNKGRRKDREKEEGKVYIISVDKIPHKITEHKK